MEPNGEPNPPKRHWLIEVQLFLVRLEAMVIVGRIVRLLVITIILTWNPQLHFKTNLINISFHMSCNQI